MEHLGGDFYVRKSTLEYDGVGALRRPARRRRAHAQRTGNSSMVLACAAVSAANSCWSAASSIYVFADPRDHVVQADAAGVSRSAASLRSRQVDGRRARRALERARASRRARSAHRCSSRSSTSRPEMEWDGADDGCVHALACNRFGLPLATGRMLEHVPGVAKIGRMAVLAPMRGGRIGRAVLDALLQHARERGDREAAAACATRRRAVLQRAPASSRAGRCSRRPAFRTSRWCARCRRGSVEATSKDSICRALASVGVSAAAAASMRARNAGSMPRMPAVVERVDLHQRDVSRRARPERRRRAWPSRGAVPRRRCWKSRTACSAACAI